MTSLAEVHSPLQTVLRNPAIWRARSPGACPAADARSRPAGKSTGFAELDAVLQEGDWPEGSLTELLSAASGVGELALLLPTLRQVAAQGRGVALLAPPWLPHAAAWESAGLALDRLLLVDASGSDLLWSAEQCLRSGECGAVVLWGQAAGRALDQRALQRLQLAAAKGNARCFVYRAPGAGDSASPAPLRLRLQAREGRLQLHCIKQRGRFHTAPVSLALFPAHWQRTAHTPRPTAQLRLV